MLGVGGWEGGMAGVAEVLNCPPTKPPVVAHPRSHEDSTVCDSEGVFLGPVMRMKLGDTSTMVLGGLIFNVDEDLVWPASL